MSKNQWNVCLGHADETLEFGIILAYSVYEKSNELSKRNPGIKWQNKLYKEIRFYQAT